MGLGQPSFNGFNAATQGSSIFVAIGNHVLHEHNVGTQVLSNGLLIEFDGTASCRTLCRGIRQFKRLLHFQVGQAFDFENAARENVFLAFFLNREQARFDGIQRNGMHQVTQGDTRLHLAFETHQHRFGHVQRHDTRGCTKGHQARTRREGNANGEASVRIATGTHGIGQQQAVEP